MMQTKFLRVPSWRQTIVSLRKTFTKGVNFRWNAINHYDLELKPDGYSHSYDPTCNPTIVNEFAGAAYRFGHSLLKKSLHRMDTTFGTEKSSLALR